MAAAHGGPYGCRQWASLPVLLQSIMPFLLWAFWPACAWAGADPAQAIATPQAPQTSPQPGATAATAPTGKWTESAVRSGDGKIGAASSVFAVVTKKGGLASALAHNHFVYAQGYSIEVSYGAGPLVPQSARVVFDVNHLMVDDPAAVEPAGQRLVQLGLAHAQFSKLSESDRKTIREHMLAEDQLWSEKFPRIEASASRFRPRQGSIGTLVTNYEADFEFTIRGAKVTKVVPLSILQRPGTVSGVGAQATSAGPIVIEGLVPLKFSDFGFKPYSGLLGAVRNDDDFHIYLRTEGFWTP